MKINGIVTANISKIDDIFLSSMSKVSGITLPVATSPYIVATGGTISRNGNYLVHSFTSSDTFSITSLSSTPAYNDLEYLIIAGGGGGGASVLSGGGGGAGGFLTGTLTPTVSNYSLVIGAGGATTFTEGDGANGFNSTGLSLTSFGGGGGARGYLGYYPAGNGGSGGGGGALNGGAGLNGYPGTGTVGQGFDGGYAYGGPGYAASGAGGGAGAIGNDADGSQGGNGGSGQFSLISGTSIYYAGGGAGGSYANTPGTGGLGGGGNGANVGAGENGFVNLGAGGGGGKTTSSGGSGIIILSYYSPQNYVEAFSTVVTSRGGSLTASEITYLTTFETAMGSDLAEFDRLWIHGLSNEIAAKTSFVNPTSTIITAVNSPTFTAYQGYQGNGTTSYLNTNFTPSTQAVKYTQSSASIFVYSLTNTVGNYVDIGIVAGTNKSFLYTRYTNGSAYYPVNMNTSIGSPSFPLANSLGFYVGNLNSTTLSLNKNGTQLASTTITPVAVPTVPFYLLAYSSTGTPEALSINQISVSGIGSGIVNQSNFYNSIQTLGTSLGWFSYTTRFKAVVLSRGGSLTASEETYLNTFETSLGTDIKEFDRLWIHGLSDSIAARTSFVNPTSTLVTEVNAPSFIPNLGYQGNGVNSYLNSNFSPAVNGVKYQQNNAGMFVYSLTNSTADIIEIGNQLGANYSYILCKAASGPAVFSINSTNDTSISVTDSLGLFQVLRTGSTPYSLYKNNVLLSTVTQASAPLLNQSYYILARNLSGTPSLPSNRIIGASGFSSSSINQSNFYNALQTLGTSLGWNTTNFKTTVASRGGTLTSAEESYLRTFEASMGSDLVDFDRLWIHGLSNEIAARTSFVNPTSTAITAVNNPTFTPNVGFIGNGSTSYLNTNYNASTQGVKYTLNNAGAFAYIRDNFVSTGCLYGTYNGTHAGAFLYPQFNTNLPIYYINNQGSDSLGTGNSFGLTTLLRTSSTLAPLYKNAVYDSATTRVSTSIPNLNHFILGFNFNGNLNSPYSKNISASGFGGANYNQSNFYNSLQTLGTSLGWAVILNNTSAYNNLSSNTTTAIKSTGAKLIVITVTTYTLGNFPTISDNLGNMWIAVGFADGTQAARVSTFYCINPITSSSHTFTAVAASAYPSLSVNLFSGPSFTFDKYSSNTGGNLTSLTSGSITPSSSRNLVITAVNYWIGATPNSISDSFIITNSIPSLSNSLAGSTAYKFNSGTVNPTWSWTGNSGDTAAMITSFTY